ncbi:MAG: zinc ribbon domain-containing protein [Opitutae bacterium]|nr:zinc ribbon domain-containing protein [Opitutae bacterium]
MPTYDYQCQACGHGWELFQSMNDSPVKSCPKCKKRKAKRLLGIGAGVIFKGTGFYETDYKKKSGGEKKGESNDSGSGESSGSEKSTKDSAASSDSTSGSDSPAKKESTKGKEPKKGKTKASS